MSNNWGDDIERWIVGRKRFSLFRGDVCFFCASYYLPKQWMKLSIKIAKTKK